jgi:hypothetical protein
MIRRSESKPPAQYAQHFEKEKTRRAKVRQETLEKRQELAAESRGQKPESQPAASGSSTCTCPAIQ